MKKRKSLKDKALMLRAIVISAILFTPLVAYAKEVYQCLYTSYSDQQGNHKEDFSLTYLVDDKEAYVIGNAGTNKVAYIDEGIGVKSFVEVTAVGNVMSTVIDVKGNSVHSRNGVGLTGEVIPSQYYGTCKIK